MFENTKEKIKDVIVESLNLDIEANEIGDEMELFGKELGLDSVDALELILGLEMEFDIKIPPGQNEKFKNVTCLTGMVLELQGC